MQGSETGKESKDSDPKINNSETGNECIGNETRIQVGGSETGRKILSGKWKGNVRNETGEGRCSRSEIEGKNV